MSVITIEKTVRILQNNKKNVLHPSLAIQLRCAPLCSENPHLSRGQEIKQNILPLSTDQISPTHLFPQERVLLLTVTKADKQGVASLWSLGLYRR